MRILRRAASRHFLRVVLCWMAAAALCAPAIEAQQSASSGSATSSTASPASAPSLGTNPGIRTITFLDGQWRFHTGDDPLWADPSFNDSSWPLVTLSQPLAEQGFETYTGYAWYRMKLEPQQLAQVSKLAGGQPLSLLLTSNTVGQLSVFVNGFEAGQTRGMTDDPSEYQSPPILVQITPANAGPTVIAVRTWAGPRTTISRGLLRKAELGVSSDMAERLSLAIGHQWTESVISTAILAFLFLCVAVLGAFLYMAQRHHPEYLWLALLCGSVAAGGAGDALFGMALFPLNVYRIFGLFTGRIFMAVTLEFVLYFTESKSRKFIRGVQIGVLLTPIVYFTPLLLMHQILSVASEVLFCGIVSVLLYKAWRRGKKEAGVMLLPFFLAATAASVDTVLDFGASRHWIPERFGSHRFYLGPIEFGTGTLAYTVFLGSLIAVILYRFVRISQEEQRSAAEISAARSVQALLIPTQLPSNKNFMLESAYLPVNGVGGDFFQVLPLKDDSLLIVVGDVSGKGLQAAMNSSTLVGALRNEPSHDPATVLRHLNHVLIGAVSSPGTAVKELDCAPCFATCLCARVYPDGTTTIANAGHLSPYRDGREVPLVPNLPLGVIADSQYDQSTFQLNRGDRLVFLSDGVVEAQNAEGELFGFERTQQVSNESARYIAQTAKRFGQTDDITVLSLYLSSRTAQPSSEEFAYSK
jgi:phosphoserine phosphatase RsbU/P